MIIIIIAAQKGGSGKTTIAVHLAVEYRRAGKRVAVLDTDPQRSAAIWGELRETDDITVAAVPAAEIGAALSDAAEDGYDVVIVDTPPHASTAFVPILRRATLVVIPFQPSPLDLATLGTMVRMIEAAKAPAVAVLSVAPLRAAEIHPMRRAIEEGGLPVLDSVIHHLMPFRRSIGNGLAVSEFDPEGRAALEIRALRKEVDKVISSISQEAVTS